MKRIFFSFFLPLFLLSAEAHSTNNYFILGTSRADVILIRKETIPSRIAGYVNGTLALNLGGSNCNSSTAIYVSALSGNDSISVWLPSSCPIQCYVYGHDGYDDFTITGCDGGAEIYGGNEGDDFYLGLESHYFNGKAYGDAGEDYFYYFLDGGTLHGGAGNDHFGWNENSNLNEYAGYVRQGYIYGDEGNDQFYGGPYYGGPISKGSYFGGVGSDKWGNGCYWYIYCDSFDYSTAEAYAFYDLRAGCSHVGIDEQNYCDNDLHVPNDPIDAPPPP